MSAHEIRELRDSDAASWLEASADAFGAARERADWSWAHERNPAGRRAFVALREGSVVAHYGAWPLRTWCDGREHVFAQVIDSFVRPAQRAGLQRSGLFVETARAFFDAYGGRDGVFFGWPIAKAWRIGRRLLDYEYVRTQQVLVRESLAGAHADYARGVGAIERFDEQALWLWERCADELRISAVRDAAFLNWRLLERPRARCEVLGLRDDAGVLRGYVALRRAAFGGAQPAIVVDWLVPDSEPEVANALLAAACTWAQRAGAPALVASAPEWSPASAFFQRHDMLLRPSGYLLAARSFSTRIDALRLRDEWWYQFAESDLV